MKKFLNLLLMVPALLLTSCSLGPTPKLYTNYEKTSLKTRKASKEEWERIVVNDDFSYICDFVHPSNGKADHFVRVFYKGNQVFEERKSGSYMPAGAFAILDTLYFVYGMFDDEQLTTVTTYCLKVNKDGQSSVFSLPGDTSCKGSCTDGEYCYFLLWERQNNVTKLIKTNLNGEIIYQEPSSNDYSGLYSDGTNLYTKSYNFSHDDDSSSFAETKVYKWKENHDDNIAVGVYSIPGYASHLTVGDKIIALSYLKKGDSYAFYKTEENESNKVCEFTTPDDLSYQYWGVEQFDDDLIIGFTASRGRPMDPYCRTVLLHYESSSAKLLSFCPNENLTWIHFRNNNVFFGNYSNHVTNETSDGNFRTFVFS